MTSEVLDVAGASALLRVSPRTVREQVRRGRLPGRRIGREWRFSRQALLDWLGTADDEPLSADDLAAIHEGLAALERGEFITVADYDRQRVRGAADEQWLTDGPHERGRQP